MFHELFNLFGFVFYLYCGIVNRRMRCDGLTRGDFKQYAQTPWTLAHFRYLRLNSSVLTAAKYIHHSILNHDLITNTKTSLTSITSITFRTPPLPGYALYWNPPIIRIPSFPATPYPMRHRGRAGAEVGSGAQLSGSGKRGARRVLVGWEGSWRGVRVRSRGCHVFPH